MGRPVYNAAVTTFRNLPFLSAAWRGGAWLCAPAQGRLRLGLAVSLAVHAAALGMHRPQPAALPAPAGLQVVLVNARTESAPIDARLLAQAQVDGGGAADRGMATTPVPHLGPAPDQVVLDAMRKRQLELESEQQRLLAQLHASRRAPAERQAAHPWKDADAPGTDLENQDSVVQNAQVAALADRVRAYNQRPRKHFFAPSTSPWRYAQYVETWRRRVEETGTRHYPAEARGRLYGSLRLTVSVRADGSVANVEIDQPSNHAVLNQAARRIVQLAAPFPPFPPDIARDTDVLAITRTWHFVNDALDTQAP